MATPNYGFEKRQKELAKKRKKEEKLKQKAVRKTSDPGAGDNAMAPDSAQEDTADSGAQARDPAVGSGSTPA